MQRVSSTIVRFVLQILHEMEIHNRQPTEQSYNSVVSACGKEGEWDDAARVAEKAKMVSSRKVTRGGKPVDDGLI